MKNLYRDSLSSRRRFLPRDPLLKNPGFLSRRSLAEKHSGRQKGMGLIETLIILLLVSIGVVALMNYQHYLSFSNNTLQQQFDATILASKQMETLRDFQVMTTTSGYTAYANIATGSSVQTLGNTSYTVAWTVTSNASPAYKTISITVSWTDRTNTVRSIAVASQVAGVDPAQQASIK